MARKIREVTEHNITSEFDNDPVFLYGGGYTAQICMPALQKYVDIEGIVDDDRAKWGKRLKGVEICGYQDLKSICKQHARVNVVLTSIYGKAIANRLREIENVSVYQMYNWHINLLKVRDIEVERCEGERLLRLKERTGALKERLSDACSADTMDAVGRFFESYDWNVLFDVCTEEECYFITEVKKHFAEESIKLVDGGAYDGEILRGIQEAGLNIDELYCFELNRENFDKLQNNIEQYRKKEDSCKIVIENKGLWDACGKACICGEEVLSKITAEKTADDLDSAETVTIDEYFKNTRINMIKMDIEGAEENALKGGLQVIRRDRPLLAISIYHRPEDYYIIPELLMKELDEYDFFVRQHAMVYGETILYAIPRKNKL